MITLEYWEDLNIYKNSLYLAPVECYGVSIVLILDEINFVITFLDLMCDVQ